MEDIIMCENCGKIFEGKSIQGSKNMRTRHINKGCTQGIKKEGEEKKEEIKSFDKSTISVEIQTEPLCDKCHQCSCGGHNKPLEFEVHSHKVEKFPLECEEIIYYDGAYLPLVNGVPVRADKNNDVSLKFLNS